MANTPEHESQWCGIAAWHLDDHPTLPDSKDYIPLLEEPEEAEVVFHPDTRNQVSAARQGDGGDRRSIVKLFMKFGNLGNDGPWAMGTGFLTTPDMVLTAAHNVYHHKYGRAAVVWACVGYGTSTVQRAYGRTIAVPGEWLNVEVAKDFAVVRVHEAFKGSLHILPLTPNTFHGVLTISVPGFPFDQVIDGEEGARLYEGETEMELPGVGARGLLQHRVSTGRGQSGAPVIDLKRQAVLGLHVLRSDISNVAMPFDDGVFHVLECMHSVVEGEGRWASINGLNHYRVVDRGSRRLIASASPHACPPLWRGGNDKEVSPSTLANIILAQSNPDGLCLLKRD